MFVDFSHVTSLRRGSNVSNERPKLHEQARDVYSY
jgi:hypothetical protein